MRTRGACDTSRLWGGARWRSLVPVLGVVLACAAPLGAQTATVVTEENFRTEPNGPLLGQLEAGTTLALEERQGSWARVTLEGYVWERSMQILREGGFDLVISEPGGENVRDRPQGRLAGRLVEGTRLQELERVPGWVRVRRTGWMWVPSLSIQEEAPPSPQTPPSDPSQTTPADPGVEAPAEDWLIAGPGGLTLLTAPDGDTLGRAGAGADVRVLSRQGNWARVQLDGWVWVPPGEAVAEADAADDVVVEVLARELREDPAGFRGRRVEMELQYISLERAEAIRTDFYEGEPFLLTRTASGERSFVYVAVPPDRLGEVEGLSALDRIRVTARVRTGAAAYTANPVLELIRFRRVP